SATRESSTYSRPSYVSVGSPASAVPENTRKTRPERRRRGRMDAAILATRAAAPKQTRPRRRRRRSTPQPVARVMRRLAPQSEQIAYSRTKPVACIVFAAARYAVEGSTPIARAAHASQKLRPRRSMRSAVSRCLAVAVGVMIYYPLALRHVWCPRDSGALRLPICDTEAVVETPRFQ